MFARRCSAVICAVMIAATQLFAGPASAAGPSSTIHIGDTQVYEGNSSYVSARVTVTLSNPQPTDVFINYTTADRTALGGTKTNGADYVSKHGRIKIKASRTEAVIAVTIAADSNVENDEDFAIVLSGATPTNILIANDTAVVTIRDDDPAPIGSGMASLTIADAAVYEGDTGFVTARLAITMSEALGTDVYANYTTTDATAIGGAKISASDFVYRHGKIKLRAGATSAVLSVKVRGDIGYEPDEAFTLVLSATTLPNVVITDGTATITIRNDDPSPIPDIPASFSVVAGPQARYLTATWSPPANGAAVVGYDLEVTRAGTTNVALNVTSPYAFGCGLASVTDTCVVRVRAFNSSGPGDWSDPVTASTWAPPAAPTNLTSVGTTIFWDAPPSDQPISNYWVFKSLNNGQSWTAVTTTTNLHASASCSVCLVRVQAQSSIGFGAFSTVSIEWAPPSSPTSLTATRDLANPALIHISWGVPMVATPPIDDYIVTINDFVNPVITFNGVAATTLDFQFRNAVHSTINITVTARNAAGLGSVAAYLMPAG